MKISYRNPKTSTNKIRYGADITPRSTNPVEFSETTLVQLERVIAAGKVVGEFVEDVDPIMALHFLGMLHKTLRALLCK